MRFKHFRRHKSVILLFLFVGIVITKTFHQLIKLKSSLKWLHGPTKITSNTLSTTLKPLKSDSVCLSVLYTDARENLTFSTMPDYTTDKQVLNYTSRGCDNVFSLYSFPLDSNLFNEEEQNYPIAYSIIAHKNAHQLLLLLSAIYAPQNIYCIHIDLKSSSVMFEAVKQAISCFPNIFLATKRINIVYAGFNRLQADLNCMEDLLNVPINQNKWEYLINLCGQDFPLRTNFEIVHQLKSLKNHNVIYGAKKLNNLDSARTKFVHIIIDEGKDIRRKHIVQTLKLKSPSPFNITVRKSSAYNIYTRRFLHWVIFESEKAKALLEWSRDTKTPDEHYWMMLDSLEEAPGKADKFSYDSLARYVIWRSPKQKCSGYWKHYSCVFGAKDVSKLVKQSKLFANKFDVQYDSLPITCLRKWLNERRIKKLQQA